MSRGWGVHVDPYRVIHRISTTVDNSHIHRLYLCLYIMLMVIPPMSTNR